MNIENITNELKLQVITGKDKLNRPVEGAYASDLLSDVMGRAKEGDVWITLQTHKNIVAVASLKEIAAIIIVNGGRPDEDTASTANEEGIIILGTEESSFITCGKLYKIMERDAMV